MPECYGSRTTVYNRFIRWKREALQSIEYGFSSKMERYETGIEAEINILHAKIGKKRDFLVDACDRLGLGSEKLLSRLHNKKK